MFDFNDFLTMSIVTLWIVPAILMKNSNLLKNVSILFRVDEQKLLISMLAVLSLISYTIHTNRRLVRERH